MRPCWSMSVTMTKIGRDGNDILNMLNAVIVQLGNVDQTLLAGGDLNKRTEVHQAGHAALVDGTDLGVLDNRLDGRNGALRVVLIDSGDKDVAVLLNIDLAAEVRAHLLNDLAALADDVLDLVDRIIMLNILGAYLDSSRAARR